MPANPRAMIQQLIESGLNEREITDAIRAEGVDISAATVNRIKTGQIKRTGFDVCLALMNVLKKRARSRKHAA
jgi:hypothetical protein